MECSGKGSGDLGLALAKGLPCCVPFSESLLLSESMFLMSKMG